tara:strand:+ start:1093 stop:1707 length:615 start_codon:yes stop_codon:yes gene_type:complete
MNEPTIYPIFSSPICDCIIEIDDNVKDYVINQQFIRNPANSAFDSVNKMLLDDPNCAVLKSEVMRYVNVFLHDDLKYPRNYEFYMVRSWATKHGPGDWLPTHVHPNSLISGNMYLKVPEDSGNITFEKETPLISWTVKIVPEEENIINSETYFFRPAENHMFLFPSRLPHRVGVNRSPEFRYGLAFNIFVRGTLGAGTTEITLI